MKIEEIKNDAFLKDMDHHELKDLANDIRTFLIDHISQTGGHLSSNLGDVELIIALHKVFNLDKDKLLFDVGHQAYTHKILTGRANQFQTLRQIDGLSGFLSMEESIYDVFESGHSSTSISTAMGMALSRDQQQDDYEIISVIGDASIANGVAFEALNNIHQQNHKVIIVLNDNNMAINESVGAIAKSLSHVRTSKPYAVAKKGFMKIFKFAPKFVNFVNRCVHRMALIFRSDNMFDNFNISYLGPIDGHNINALCKAFKKAKSYPGPILVHVKTKKGYGYKFSENDTIGKFHGVAPFDKLTGEDLHHLPENRITFTQLVANTLYDILKEDKDAYLISSAMVYCTNLTKCFEVFKDHCIDVGIAEEHSIAFANGLALAKKTPYVSLYSTFMQRGYDEIVHDVCRINSNITFFVDRAGIVGEDGKTHQGMFDVSFVYPLENAIITMLSAGKYLKPLLKCLYSVHAPKFIRYQKMDTKKEDMDINIEFGQFIEEIYDESYPVSMIVAGASCEKIKEIILSQNLKINLINPIFMKPIDEKTLQKISNTQVIVYDNTSVFEGFCSAIVHYYNEKGLKVKCYCLPHQYIKHGKYYDILKYLELDEETIIQKVINENGKD